MENYKELIIKSIREINGFKFIDDPYLQPDNTGIVAEWKDARFLLYFNSSYDDSNLDSVKSLEAPFSIFLPYVVEEKYQSIPLLDKYRVANQVNDKSLSLAKISYREQIDMFLIASPYYPMLEQLNEFKSKYSSISKKGGPFIVLSLLTMCMESAKDLNSELDTYKKDPKKYHSQFRD